MVNPLEIGNYFLMKGFVDNIPLSPQKLSKLIIIANDWFDELTGSYIIDSTYIQNNKIDVILDTFDEYGKHRIKSFSLDDNGKLYYPSKNIHEFLNQVWLNYGKKSYSKL